MAIDYDELRLRVKPGTSTPDTWDIEVVNASELPALKNYMGKKYDRSATVHFTPEMLRRLRSPYSPPDEGLLQQAGKAVFETLLCPNILGVFNALRSSPENDKRGVRIVVHLIHSEADQDEEEEDDRRTISPAELPVELMYEDHHSYFATTVTTPLLRTFDYGQETVTAPVTPPLRILIVGASPKRMTPLSIDKEVAGIKKVLADLITAGTVEVDESCVSATASMLTDKLNKENVTYDIVHFICHGKVNPGGQSYIFLMDEAGTGEAVRMNADQLTMLLRDRAVRLIVFSSCCTAQPPLAEGAPLPKLPWPYPQRVFSGIAQRLITAHAHVGAVVAMQFDLEDAAAVVFSGAFYHSLIVGNATLEEAVTAARKRVNIAMPQGHRAWITPVLYSRARNGRLFEMDQLPHLDKLRPDQEAHLKTLTAGMDLNESLLAQTLQKTTLEGLEELAALQLKEGAQQALHQKMLAEVREMQSAAAILLGNTCWLGTSFCAQGGKVSVPLHLRLKKAHTVSGVLLTVGHPPGLVLEGATVTGPPPLSLGETSRTAPQVPQPLLCRDGCSQVFLNFTTHPLNLPATTDAHVIAWLNFAAPAFAPGRAVLTLSSCMVSTAEGWKQLATQGSSVCVAQPSASALSPAAAAAVVVAAAGGG